MRTKTILFLMTLGVLLAQASRLDGIWVNFNREAGIRKVVIHGERINLHTRRGVLHLIGERVGPALVTYRPRRQRRGDLIIFRSDIRDRLRIKIRKILANGMLGASREMTFHHPRRHGVKAYLGEWRMREPFVPVPLQIRITQRQGRVYIEAWQTVNGHRQLLVRNYGQRKNGKIVVTWRDRQGWERRAVIEGERQRDREGRFRYIRVTVHRSGDHLPVVYHLERVWRRGIPERNANGLNPRVPRN